MIRPISLFAGTLLCVTLAACGPVQGNLDSVSVYLISPDGRGTTVSVELARTPEEQQRGLMGRPSLPPDTGMLFVFPESHIQYFWMKDTLIPLDILFFDEVGRFVSSLTMAPCPAETQCPTYASQGPARYVLEVPQGFMRQQGVGDQWQLSLGPWATP